MKKTSLTTTGPLPKGLKAQLEKAFSDSYGIVGWKALPSVDLGIKPKRHVEKTTKSMHENETCIENAQKPTQEFGQTDNVIFHEPTRSNCCSAVVKIGGDPDSVTRYHVCTKCGEPCDADYPKGSEFKNLTTPEIAE